MNDRKRKASKGSAERREAAKVQAEFALDAHEAAMAVQSQPGIVLAKNASVFGRVASYFRGEYAWLTSNSDVTLEQLYQVLMAKYAKDRLERSRFEEMMFVIASDLRNASALPGIARPMREWRKQYRELDRFIGR